MVERNKIQVGGGGEEGDTGEGGGEEQDNQSGFPPSNLHPRRNSMNFNATLEYLPPASEREARNLSPPTSARGRRILET